MMLLEGEEDIASLNASFPQKLYVLMHRIESDSDAITWLAHGKAFKILDPENFSIKVVPKYFKHAKLTSFQRQLNLYGFRRITKGDDAGAYYHPSFQKGRGDLLGEIKRIPTKSAVPPGSLLPKNAAPYYEMLSTSSSPSSAASSSSSSSSLTSSLSSSSSTYSMRDRSCMSGPGSVPHTTRASSRSLNRLTREAANEGRLGNPAPDAPVTRSPSDDESENEGAGGNSGTPISYALPLAPELANMSKITMNIGFGRDIRQGQLQPPVKKRCLPHSRREQALTARRSKAPSPTSTTNIYSVDVDHAMARVPGAHVEGLHGVHFKEDSMSSRGTPVSSEGPHNPQLSFPRVPSVLDMNANFEHLDSSLWLPSLLGKGELISDFSGADLF